MHAATAVTQNF